MSHKFKARDKVRIENLVGSAEVLTNDMHYKLNSDPHDLSTLPLYDVRYGNQVLRVLEAGLEKIEEPEEEPNQNPEPKYKIGDVVFFVCNVTTNNVTTNEQIEGEIKNIKNGIYTIENKQHPGYFFSLAEKYITNLAPLEEFKEGDEVWIRAKVSPWDGVFFHGALRNSTDEISINFLPDRENVWIKNCNVIKSLPPKNDWIMLGQVRMPPIATPLSCYRKIPYTYPRSSVCTWDGENFYELGTKILFDATHWKPLDAPSNE